MRKIGDPHSHMKLIPVMYLHVDWPSQPNSPELTFPYTLKMHMGINTIKLYIITFSLLCIVIYC